MKNGIIIISPDKKWGKELSSTIAQEQIHSFLTSTLDSLEQHLSSENFIAAILDIDLLPINNRMIRKLTLEHPGVSFLGVSDQRLHPDLKDAICYHLYACIQKPVDMTELLYFVQSIYNDSSLAEG